MQPPPSMFTLHNSVNRKFMHAADSRSYTLPCPSGLLQQPCEVDRLIPSFFEKKFFFINSPVLVSVFYAKPGLLVHILSPL